MKNRILTMLNVLMFAAIGLLMAPDAASAAAADDDATTEDIIFMVDGRELHGQILEEKSDVIIFEYVDQFIKARTKLTLLKEEIADIKRDVAIEGAKPAEKKDPRWAPPKKSEDDEPERTFGARHTAKDLGDLPTFYVVPMKGQMGTDVVSEIYEDMIDDIREKNPDILVIQMECRDNEDVLYSLIGEEEASLADFDDFRKLLDIFREELRDVRQVVWIKDSVGVSSALAMAWSDIYMTPDARFGGLIAAKEQTNFDGYSDDDVRGKMTAAFMSWVKGFLEFGGYSLVLADAMVRPEFTLSGSWKGREVEWRLDEKGQYIVDQSDKRTAEFTAKTAEDFCISDGTADSLDDLALLLGIREYGVLDSKAEQICENYTENWRRTFENCAVWLRDYQQYMGWASGEDTLKWLGRAKSRLEQVVASMERYPAVELRLARDYGVRKFDLITTIEQLKEQIAAIRRNRGLGGGGGGGGRGGGVGAGGG